MSEFDQEALTWMRETLANTLPHRATLYTPHYAPDDGGGQVVTWDLVQTDVPCRLHIIGQNADGWELFADSLQNKPRYRAVFLHNAPLTIDMRVVIADLPYRVMSCSTDHNPKLVIHAVLVGE
ncbi:MAG: hypothetical protein SFZ02_11285 [bacterium]|nr:hypothetical protein [bacterium]